MTTFVKNFIQNNKDIINQSNWETVCDEWLTSAQNEAWYNDSLFDEFCSIMSLSGIPFLEQSVEQRENTVRLQIQFAFDHYVSQNVNDIEKDSIRDWICTTFGLTGYEIHDIADDMAKHFGYRETAKYYTKN